MARCKQCNGSGLERVYLNLELVDADECPTCYGTGERRTGPYRLDDGTWSDGVDRTHRLWSVHFSARNPDRVIVEVERSYGGLLLCNVYKGFDHLQEFDSFAEATAYADKYARMARANQGENNV